MWDTALSTMWSLGRFTHLKDFFPAAQQLGFERFELNHGINSHMLNGVDLGRLNIVSLHEPCPADISTKTLRARNWLVSSPDPENRQQGVHAVQRSIDLAQELGVSVLVMHPGRVDVDAKMERDLWDLFEAGQAQTPAYAELKERLVAARAAQAGANLEAVHQSLTELAEYAGRAGIRLGLENRYHFLDIPLLDEMESLLELTNDGRIGFWYDTGHGQTLDNLGFIPHTEWLRRYADRMLGVHLHDIRGLKDHFAAGLGEMDWDMVTAHLPDDIVRTCEFRAHNTPEQVVAAMELLATKGCVTRLD